MAQRPDIESGVFKTMNNRTGNLDFFSQRLVELEAKNRSTKQVLILFIFLMTSV